MNVEQLSLFKDDKKIFSKTNSIIISASRMTDMPKFYPKELINEVKSRMDKGTDIHTLVLWSKHPDSLLENELFNFLNQIRNQGIQLFYQCTITGMGNRVLGKNKDGSDFILEPNVPKPYKAFSDLENVIALLGSPLRIRLRIDPIVKLKNKYTCEEFTNLLMIDEIIKRTSKLGINNYTFSFLENGIHNKIDYRFNKYEWNIVTPNLEEKRQINNWLKEKAEKYNVKIESCCVQGLDSHRCIDGYLLSELHNEHKEANLKEPKKRKLCSCTNSIDIGGWPPKKCYSGCKYCYANAFIK